MKKHFLALLIVLPLIVSAERSKESIPVWYTGEQTIDAKLGSNEAVLEMHFQLYDYTLTGDSLPPLPKIVYALNGKMDSMEFPKNGMIDLPVKPGTYIGQFYAGPDYYEVKTGDISVSEKYRRPVYINLKSSIHPVIEDKPVIYVYSDQPQQVSLQLKVSGTLGFTYPAYNSGWNFVADKDGNIYSGGKTYPYLFWEAQTNLNYGQISWENGAVVSKDSLVSFFERNLSAMGLNEKEITDYITYWVPRMSVNEFSYVHFLLNEDYEQYASMNISPKPDSKFQVFMLWSAAEAWQSTFYTAQQFKSFDRKGLTVVEWGGTELSDPLINDENYSLN